ncbi:MAG: hypothetical protein R2744_01880, partial [Bacteroidales bacterium]
KLKQKKKGLDPVSLDLYEGPLFGSDTFLGIPVLKADSIATFRQALKSALKSEGTVIIDAAIDPVDYSSTVIVQ